MVTVNTYGEFQQYITYHFTGNTPLTILLGPPGVGKTEAVKTALRSLKEPHKYISGYMTKTQFIRTLYECRDQHIIIDDTDNLFADKGLFGVLRAAFDTGGSRTVDYASPHASVQDLPQSFEITAPLLIITNGLDESTVMQAFKSRAICVDFRPTPEAIVEKLHELTQVQKRIPYDVDVYKHYAELLPLATTPNFRAYLLSLALKGHGIDWQKHLREALGVDPLLAMTVAATHAAKTYKQRIKIFAELTGKSARTYDRLLKAVGKHTGAQRCLNN